MSGLELRDLTVGYTGRRGRTVAAGLTASADTGRLTALIGPNGAGKSTLLRTVCGLQKPLAGSAHLADGTVIGSLRAAELARRIAVVTTDPVDPGRLTAHAVVALGRTPYLSPTGRLSAADRARTADSLSAVRASHLAGRQFHDLSDGERQRVLAARALAQEPELLVLDEPTSHLDAPSRVEFLDLLQSLAREQNIAVLMSSHDLELVMRLSDEVWLLQADGRMRTGTPARLAESGAVSDAFDRGRLRFDPATFVFGISTPGPDAC
ncbi:ABC transporter ATP-binding protein [Gordonia zhaorongruii]|uniref:ABC transporter ATP-binding protein n=1 Tax=Gordonia zhaorongruii TaxID=2597659 RepID=UPI00117DB46E|nr:ABC transporter ATP-binding protein [Gordonia zhaorongruii]